MFRRGVSFLSKMRVAVRAGAWAGARSRENPTATVSTLAAIRNFPRESIFRLSNGRLLAFSIFTWLGFDPRENVEDDIVINIKSSTVESEPSIWNETNVTLQAEQMLHLVLRLAQQTMNETAITYVYDVLANLALEREQYEKAEKLFVNVMQRLLSRGLPESDRKNVHISLKLAHICHKKGELDKAEIGFKWSMDNLLKIEKPTDDDLLLSAMGKAWYARLLIDLRRHKDSLLLLTESYRILEQFEDHLEQSIMLLNDEATVRETLEDYDGAEQCLLKASSLGKKIPDAVNLSAIHINLGRLYMKKGLLVQARKACGYGWRLAADAKNKECQKEAILCINEVKQLSK